MPPNWVTWAIMAALLLGLSEIGVPPGAATMQKLSAFFPGATDVVLSLGSQMLERFSKIEQYRSSNLEAEQASAPPPKPRPKRRV